ncbi:hypothetical protein LCGC14_2703130, partial [marine sediment metagenome]
RNYSNWSSVPREAFDKLVRLGVAIDDLIEECGLDAVAIRCWLEMQQQLGISPCVLLSELNNRGMVAACEVDVGNAVTMYGLSKASGDVATCLDWNNNYGDDPEKCILFHCGNVPHSMLCGPSEITEHSILANVVGKGCSYGCNLGRIAPTDFTFGSLLTEDGKIKTYLGRGRFTDAPIPDDFFGSAGAAEIPNLQQVLQMICRTGHRHHVSLSSGLVVEPMAEAFEKYLGFEVTRV